MTKKDWDNATTTFDGEIDLTKEEMNVSDEEYKIQKALGSTPTKTLSIGEMYLRHKPIVFDGIEKDLKRSESGQIGDKE